MHSSLTLSQYLTSKHPENLVPQRQYKIYQLVLKGSQPTSISNFKYLLNIRQRAHLKLGNIAHLNLRQTAHEIQANSPRNTGKEPTKYRQEAHDIRHTGKEPTTLRQKSPHLAQDRMTTNSRRLNRPHHLNSSLLLPILPISQYTECCCKSTV